MTVAIIGAGLAGIAAGRRLAAAGLPVRLFEKSRGLGGRIATRRGPAGAVDHGAPLLHGLPAEVVAAAGAAAAPWRDGHVGVPGNSALARALAAGLAVEAGGRVTGLARRAAGWTLARADAPPAGPFAAVLLAVPLDQAAALLGPEAARFPALAGAAMKPGLTLIAWFADPVAGPDWRRLDPPLALAVRGAAKPGRTPGEAWAVHAADAWAAAHLERPPDAVAAALLAAFRAATGAGPATEATAHRWRYARVARPAGVPCLWDEAAGLGLAGDWCLGPDAGDAVASGAALGDLVAAAIAG